MTGWHPAQRWHDLHGGFYIEHGNLSSDVKGAIQAVKLLEYEYRGWHRGGLIRSNDESFVMKEELRDQHIQ